MGYTIGSFNLLKLYEKTVEQRRRDWKLIARIIRTEQLDLVAIQEVFSDAPIKMLHSELNRGYFSSWEYRVGIKQTVRNSPREGYAFLWNSRRLSLLRKKDGTVYEPEVKSTWSRSLIRPPFLGRFMPIGWTVPFIELRVINTHIVHSKDLYMKNKGSDDSALELRKKEYQKLSDEVFPRVAKDRSEGMFRPAYTFIMGDYNLFNRQCSMIDTAPKSEFRYMRTRQSAPTTLEKSKEDEKTGYTENDFDHLSFSNHEDDYVHVV